MTNVPAGAIKPKAPRPLTPAEQAKVDAVRAEAFAKAEALVTSTPEPARQEQALTAKQRRALKRAGGGY